MRFRVFAQKRRGALPVLELSASAQRLLSTPLAVTRDADDVILHLAGCTARVRSRDASESDWSDAVEAEAAGQSAGMSALARRCETIWCVEIDGSAASAWGLVAVLASVALGPVLPQDGTRLIGTRTALLEYRSRD